MISNLDMYCITDKKLNYLEKLPFNLGAVGYDNFDQRYISSNSLENIYHKEKYYSELTFHYWFWKNKLKYTQDKWVGFCQKRRFWIDPKADLDKINEENYFNNLLLNIENKYKDHESIICNPIKVSGVKKMKILKRGWRNFFKEPSIFFNEDKQSILLHFDMHHGYKNLEKAIDLLSQHDRLEFYEYVEKRNFFNPNIMFIAKPHIAKKWFDELFPWLERCEKIFGFDNLKGYDTTRLYAYLAERYLSFWFKKYTKYLEFPYFTLKLRRDGRVV